jgi:hypothetical protein
MALILGLAALSFLDGVIEAEAAIPSGVSIVLLRPRCYCVGSDIMVEQGGCVVQEYAQTVVCAGDRWKIVYPVLVRGWKSVGLISSSDVVVVRGVSSGVQSRVWGHVAPVRFFQRQWF